MRRDAERARDRTALVLIGLVSGLVLLTVAVLLLGGRPSATRAAEISALPALNAGLNGSAAVLLALGFVFVRWRQASRHRACMLGAFAASSLFLVSYVVYHARAGSVPFTGQGWIRAVYFVLLLSHIVLAAAIVPLALTTIYRAWSERFDRHRRIARWTLPVWLYVSLSGVVIYWMLHRL